MTYEEKYFYWEMISDYDTATAEDMIKAQRWLYVATICYSSVCRLLKGLIVCRTRKEAPKSDNLIFLLGRLTENEDFRKSDDYAKFSEDKADYLDLIADITFYHISDYPFSYQKINDRFIGKETALEVYDKTKKVITWLKGIAPKRPAEINQ